MRSPPSSETRHNVAGEALSNEDLIDRIVEQLRAVAPELDELRIRQIAVQLREDMREENASTSSAPGQGCIKRARSSALPERLVAA